MFKVTSQSEVTPVYQYLTLNTVLDCVIFNLLCIFEKFWLDFLLFLDSNFQAVAEKGIV